MSDVPSWVHAPVINHTEVLNHDQIVRLKAMTELLREDLSVLLTVAAMKQAFAEGKTMDAVGLWDDLSQQEQVSLWVAPKFGGIFTTAERKAIQERER